MKLIKGEFKENLDLLLAPAIRAGFPSPAEDYLSDSLDFASRSFNGMIGDFDTLRTHISNYASRCAEKLRKQNTVASVVEWNRCQSPVPCADFLLVDKDVLTCPVTEIHEAKPAATYFEGKKVFSL